MVMRVNPVLGIMIIIYVISGVIMRFCLQIRAGKLLAKKLDCLEPLGLDKFLLFIPEFVPLSVLEPIYEGLSSFNAEKYELEDYIKPLKLYRKIFFIPAFIIGSLVMLYLFITNFVL